MSRVPPIRTGRTRGSAASWMRSRWLLDPLILAEKILAQACALVRVSVNAVWKSRLQFLVRRLRR